MRRSGLLFAFFATAVLAAAPDLTAQDSPPPPPPPPTGAPPAAPQPPAAPLPPAAPQPPSPPANMGPRKGPNVRVDVTIKDHRANLPPVTKNVSIVVASGEQGRVRTFVTGHGPGASLNVDAYPAVQDGGAHIALRLGLEYRQPKPGGDPNETAKPSAQPPATSPMPVMPSGIDIEAETRVDESIWVVLDDGKPMLVTQSADPLTDRKVTVEVKATVLK